MIQLFNGILSVDISEMGAEIKSIRKDGRETIWCGDPQVWAGTAPVLFPSLCAMKNDRYILEGKTYPMAKHGFVRGREFGVESVSETSATLIYTQNDETLAMYPFDFEFRVIVTLVGASVQVEYRVTNLNDRTMYFSVGAHEAYATPEGVEDYDLIFDEREDLDTYLLADGLLLKNTMTVGKDTAYLPLYDKYFMLDTLIFKHLKSKAVTLRNRKTGRAVRVDFPHCDYLGIWHKPSAGYLCIEPWAGLPDNLDTDGNLATKEGIVTLAPHGEYRNIHTITV